MRLKSRLHLVVSHKIPWFFHVFPVAFNFNSSTDSPAVERDEGRAQDLGEDAAARAAETPAASCSPVTRDGVESGRVSLFTFEVLGKPYGFLNVGFLNIQK